MSLNNFATMARLDRLTLAIGEDGFGQVLLESARAVADVDHVMVFAFAPRRPPRAVINVGGIDPRLSEFAAASYASDLYLLEEQLDTIVKHDEGPPIWLDHREDAAHHEDFEAGFFDTCSITDRLSFVVCRKDVRYLVLFLRTEGRTFARAQEWLLNQLGDMVAAHICKHFCYMNAVEGQNQFLLARVLKEAPLFVSVSPRERLVCIGILTGHTSESIAENLSISINSVLTYRKRLYEKLGISSQNELFVQVIDAMMALSGEHEVAGDGAPMSAVASRARRNGRPLAANLAFAEAFFG